MDPYEKFIQLYNDGVPRNRMCIQLHIGNTTFNSYRNRAKRENRITVRSRGKQKPKRKITNIHRSNPLRNIYNIKHKGVYYCNVQGYRNAEKIVKRLEDCGWDKSQAKRIKCEVLSES